MLLKLIESEYYYFSVPVLCMHLYVYVTKITTELVKKDKIECLIHKDVR